MSSAERIPNPTDILTATIWIVFGQESIEIISMSQTFFVYFCFA